MCRRVRTCVYVHIHGLCAGACVHCRVRMHACTLCGRMLVCDYVRVLSAGVGAHVCMCGCVCACACACMRVHARVRVCVRGRAHVCQGACVSVRARPYASCTCACGFLRGCGARARKCKYPHEKMRLYMCVSVRAYGHVYNVQTHKNSACCLKETTPQTGGGHL